MRWLTPPLAEPVHEPLTAWESTLPRSRYEQAVRRAIDYIRAGDVFQVNLSQRLGTGWSGDPFALYGTVARHQSRRPSWRSCGSGART